MTVSELANFPPWEWPESAAEEIKRTLRDRRNVGRLTAAELGGDLVVMDDEMADLLSSIVQDSSEPDELRERAAISLAPVLEQCWVEGYEYEDGLTDPPIEEATYNRLRETLRRVHEDERAPKGVRRMALEAAIRAEEDWLADAVRKAYSRPDDEWKLTAVFCMRYLEGFEKEIMESLRSPNPDIHREAVRSAGQRGLDAAWPHIKALLSSGKTPKPLLLAAIEAAGGMHNAEASGMLAEFTESADEDIVDAADDALTEANSAQEDWDEDEEDDEEA